MRLKIVILQLSSYFVQITSEIELRDAIYCMCLSLNALVILLALFGPKVYIAILRPEKNNQSSVMGKNYSFSKMGKPCSNNFRQKIYSKSKNYFNCKVLNKQIWCLLQQDAGCQRHVYPAVQGSPKVGIQLLNYFLYVLKLLAVHFMLLVKYLT